MILRHWPKDKIHMAGEEWAYARDFAPRAFAAIGELCGGAGRIEEEVIWGDGFIANYGWGRDREWAPPGRDAGVWHKDGIFSRIFSTVRNRVFLFLFFSPMFIREGEGPSSLVIRWDRWRGTSRRIRKE
jgi:hypothetical protein